MRRLIGLFHYKTWRSTFCSSWAFCEWVIDDTNRKAKEIQLEGVHYVADLEPYIERKLFSVNTGHATVAYTGALLGYQTIDEAMQDALVVAQLKSVLQETGKLLVAKWNFDEQEHAAYIEKIIQRFQNKYISDAITRVARTPIRKLGAQERFIRPIRELQERNLVSPHLLAMIGIVLIIMIQKMNKAVNYRKCLTKKALIQWSLK